MPDHVQLDLPIVLPDVPGTVDVCVDRLTASLREQEGVSKAHVIAAADGEPDRLCIHYDPEAISLPRIRQRAQSLGTELTDQYGHLSWAVRGISHSRRARTIARRLRQIDGVVEAEASAAEQIRVEYDRSATGEDEIPNVLRLMDVQLRGDVLDTRGLAADETATADGDGEHDHDHGGIFGTQTELIFAILAGVCLAAGFELSFAGAVPDGVSLGLYVGGYVFGGYYTVRATVDTLRAGGFEADFLMLVAAIGAAVLGKWLEGAFLLFLFSLGHSLEHYAMRRARRAIKSLAELAPDTALVRRDGVEREVAVDELEIGDTVVVKPNERVPADGVVTGGESAVNQAPVTGESVPVDKTPVDNPDAALQDSDDLGPAHRLFAGTINGSGALETQVTRRADETTISQVVEMIAEAEAEKSPTERFTDRFKRHFVPAVLGLMVLLLFAWIPLDEPFADSFYRAMAILVAPSPCAPAIATPSAVLSALARGGRGGVLVKGGGPLEQLGRLGAVAFGKTGTLTEGEPRVTDVHLHDLESITGRGVTAAVGGLPVHVGKAALFDEVDGPPLPDAIRDRTTALEAEGRTTIIVRRGVDYLGVLGLADTPRPEAADVVDRLRRVGIRRMMMLSGDNQRVVDAVARQLGLDEARGDLFPDDKVATVRALRDDEDVAVIGDGANDAPAMANATVGIAMGAAGSDVALETADVALMADELSRLPFAVGLSRQTRRVITQNLWIALGMVAILVLATIFGLNIGPAVVLHEGSTLLVVGNALRLLGYES